jgi:Rieske 2Fe-2S family protein
MPEDFDGSNLGLKAIQVKLFHGFIFVSFAADPPDFAAAERDLESRLRPFGFEQAKVVKAESFRIEANWKLMLENYIECYHCATAHPEFAKSHSIKLPRERSAALQGEMMARAAKIGLDESFIDHSWEPGFDEVQVYYDRYALYPGYETGSEDGKPLAPLMGGIGGYDGGAMNLQLGPVTYFLAYNDHVVVYRFIARGLQETDADVIWLVKDTAEEGKDYDLDRLTWLWQVTTAADKRIVERNQEGVNSRYYEPGPYAPMEWHSSRFVAWYLDAIG